MELGQNAIIPGEELERARRWMLDLTARARDQVQVGVESITSRRVTTQRESTLKEVARKTYTPP